MKGALLLVSAIALLVGSCAAPGAGPGLGSGTPPPSPAGMSVVASFYPLTEFSRRIGGDTLAVRNLVPAGASAHDYEPTPQDVAALHGARVLVYNGAGFEPWLEKLLPTLPDTVARVNATEGLPLLRGIGDHDHAHEKPAAGAKPHGDRAAVDPHVWLDPILAQRQVDRILQVFAGADPDRKAAYEANAAELRADLAALDRRATETLKSCRTKTLVTTHAAFQYFANRYGLRLIPITGLSPEVEPSPARLRAVLREVRRHRVRAIYFETLTSPKVAQTLAREVGARTLALNPVEGLTPEEQAAGATYFTVMDENLRSLADGLDCR
jgi:zinc transport system substrate-binding protein